jgi:ABC-type uncharacterized transport system substrate-binding protein
MRNYWRLTLIVVAMFLHGCVQPPKKEAPPPPPAPVAKRPAPEVVILVSENVPAYTKVANLLARQLGRRGSIRYLTPSVVENAKIVDPYKNDDHKQFVSVGLSASVAAKALQNRQVVFCQVFNYQEYGLLGPKHKGVSMIPSMSRTFAAWRAIAPRTSDVGVIVGPGLDDMMQVATAIAKRHGIALHYSVVNSDKEYLFAYKQMADQVQGYWLLPDNRVLSGNALREVMTFSVRNSKQVVVFSNELLNLGGLISATTDYRNVAQQVLDRLESAQDKDSIPGPDIAYLDRAVLRINPVMAQRFGLEIPRRYKKYAKEN